MIGPQIAHALGLRPAGKGRWQGKCPCCGYQSGFTIAERHDGLPLLYCHVNRCSFSDLSAALRRLGLWPEPREPVPRNCSHQAAAKRSASNSKPAGSDKQAMALNLWRRTGPGQHSFAETAVTRYLRNRAYVEDVPATIRLLSPAKHPSGVYVPAMVALVEHVELGPVAVHRTFLKPDGSGKADLDPVKMTLGPCKGAAVRLAAAGPTLAVSEGIETGLSYMQATGMPTWAALSAGGIRSLVLPPETTEVVIAADPDSVGVLAAQAAAQRWLNEGRCVSIARPPLGLDFNDIARGRP